MALPPEQRQKIVQAAIKDAKAGKNLWRDQKASSSAPPRPQPEPKK